MTTGVNRKNEEASAHLLRCNWLCSNYRAGLGLRVFEYKTRIHCRHRQGKRLSLHVKRGFRYVWTNRSVVNPSVALPQSRVKRRCRHTRSLMISRAMQSLFCACSMELRRRLACWNIYVVKHERTVLGNDDQAMTMATEHQSGVAGNSRRRIASQSEVSGVDVTSAHC